MIYPTIKRIFDFILALIAIIVLSPILIIAGLGVKFSSKGPAIYKHERLGKDGKIFSNYKFRSMVVGARALQKKGVKDEQLIFPFGRFIRRIHMDELPQLFNILKGDMSFVGPRPMDLEFYNSVIQTNKIWKEILKIRPGLTCLESVVHELPKKADEILKEYNLRIEKPFDYMHERLIMDLYYIKHQSFLLDLKLILFTIKLVFINVFTKNYYKSRITL
jgi:lipopolysaccharide/colanic/teichoic acid biosynthesis glycosyltransferase